MSTKTDTAWQVLQGKVADDARFSILTPWLSRLKVLDDDDGQIRLSFDDTSLRPLFTNHHQQLLMEAVAAVDMVAVLDDGVDVPSAPASPVSIDMPLINPAHTLSALERGPSNYLACGAALAVSQNPGAVYSPLFIYGGVGIGKTHLLHAIIHEMRQLHPSMQIAYFKGKTFLQKVRSARDTNTLDEFRASLSTCNALFLDDVHFLADDEAAQEEFLSFFNSLINSQQQVVVTANGEPKEIQGLSERLTSRFRWGLVLDIESPTPEMRLAIVRRKALGRACDLPEPVQQFIADNIRSNICELEGAVVKVCGYMSLLNRTLDVQTARQVLAEYIAAPDRIPSISDIRKAVCEAFHVDNADMLSPSRAHSIAFPRQIAMYLSRELTSSSLEEIGNHFGGRDHSTIKYGCEKIRRLIETDASTRSLVQGVKQSLLVSS